MSLINIDYRDRRPIYEQLVASVKRLIATDLLKPDEFLPSVRSLAGELGINPNTIQKAYAELERDGVITTIPGKGSIILKSARELKSSAAADLEKDLAAIVKRAKELSLSRDEIIELFDNIWNGGSAQ